MGLKQNTWKINQWYDQAVAGNVEYNGTAAERTKLYVWGANALGELGQNAQGGWSEYLTAQSSPIQIPGDWSQVVFGPQYAFGINTDNELYAWGQNNTYGQLGLNNKTEYSSPVQVPGTTWNQVFNPGYAPSGQFAIRTDGTLWSWGYNYVGSLGTPAPGVSAYSSPIQIGSDTNWKSGAKNMASACAVKTDGTLWAWGLNSHGALGQNSVVHQSSPIQIPGTTWSMVSGSYNGFTAIKTDGTLWEWGGTEAQNVSVPSGKRSSPVQIGSATDWSTFDNKTGASCGGALKTDGTLWLWGINDRGQIGNNFGSNNSRYSSPVQVPGTWTNLGGNSHHNYATKSDGTLWAWGNNEKGNLGQNSLTDYSSPVQIPGTTWNNIFVSPDGGGSTGALATKTDGTLWAWGYQNYGQLGLNQHNVNISSPTQIPGTNWKDSKASYSFTGWAVTQAI